VCRLADDQPSRRCLPLQAGGGVHHVTGDGLADDGARAHSHDGLTRLDPDPDLQVHGGVRLPDVPDVLQQPKPGQHGALRVVLVRARRAEHPEHAVADELVERPAVAFDLLLRHRVIRPERGANVLGVGAVRAGGEADQVREQDRDDLPFLGGRGLGTCGERLAARPAESRLLRIVGSALRTDHSVRA
jgi:hypothetical protein